MPSLAVIFNIFQADGSRIEDSVGVPQVQL